MINNFVNDRELPKHPLYNQIMMVLNRLDNANFFSHGQGHCYAMSDVLCSTLRAVGIDCSMNEVECLITNDDKSKFIAVGLMNNLMSLPGPNQIPTHVVVTIPHAAGDLLIDSSINHLIPDPYNIVFGMLDDKPDSVARFKRNDVNISYLHKLGPKLPQLQDINVKQSLEKDSRIRKQVLYLWSAFSFAMVCLLAFSLGWYTNYSYIQESRERAARNAERMNLLIERMNFIEKQINEMNNRYMTIHDSRNIENAARDRRIDELQQQITQQGQTLANTRNLFMEHMNGDLKSHSKQ